MSISLQRLQVIGAEPISLAEAKLHLRVDFDDDDTLIESLITAARQYAEQVTGRSLVKSQWLYGLDCFPYGYTDGNAFPPARTSITTFANCMVDAQAIYLPRAPLISVDSIKYCPSVTGTATLDSSQYVVDNGSEPARITPALNCYFPTTQIGIPNSVQITFTAGYDHVPEPIRAAMLLTLGNWYDNRSDSKDIPQAANFILSSWRLSAAGLI